MPLRQCGSSLGWLVTGGDHGAAAAAAMAHEHRATETQAQGYPQITHLPSPHLLHLRPLFSTA